MTVVTDPFAAAPQLMKQWMGVSLAVQDSLEPSLIELVKIRASILNACANCINMHTAEARAKGETEQRIYLLAAWHEAPVYTPRERAALAWTDALTRLAEGHTQQAAKDGLEAHFTAEEQVKLTLMINIINGWNRIAVGFDLWLETPAAKAA
ncbi:MAG TPA: carboxymuconolactone decarboxylase family protein [Sphingopyxis sp.]|jgi:AhpD family alkylhydroperoxidase|uniref:carboxymuconolactone decarboxylase family protein n=1 Tax=Sphingopyxis sp. TaxID=1908224 RepID=UPI002E153910|nr:carboxymuconolactone decarboxylase family protein [Sphingopyxis sp.]